MNDLQDTFYYLRQECIEVLILIMIKKANIGMLQLTIFLTNPSSYTCKLTATGSFKDCLPICQEIHKHKQDFIITEVSKTKVPKQGTNKLSG